MNNKEIKEIIIALIQSGQFTIYDNNEETAREIARFEKAYFDESNKNNKYAEIDTSAILI